MKHTLYGAKAATLAHVGQAVSAAFSVELAERESDYLGVYLSGKVLSTKIRVVTQPDPEGEPLEKGFPEWNVLIYLDGPDELPSLHGIESGDGVIQTLRG